MDKTDLIEVLEALQEARKREESFWSKNSGTIAASLLVLFFGFAGMWAVEMDRNSVKIATKLDGISDQIQKIEGIDKRVSTIEDTRFSSDDAKEMRSRIRALEGRVSKLEGK